MNKKYKEYIVEPPLVTKHDLENVEKLRNDSKKSYQKDVFLTEQKIGDFVSGNSVKKKLVDSMIGNIPIVIIDKDMEYENITKQLGAEIVPTSEVTPLCIDIYEEAAISEKGYVFGLKGKDKGE